MYADYIVLVAERWEQLVRTLEEWKKHGLKMNLEKTEFMWVGKQVEEINK